MTDQKTCLYCERSSEDVPLLSVEYKGKEWAICPQHLPMLIHQPHLLKGKLPDVEQLGAADHHD